MTKVCFDHKKQNAGFDNSGSVLFAKVQCSPFCPKRELDMLKPSALLKIVPLTLFDL
jgi:hypothetical protein